MFNYLLNIPMAVLC